MRRAGTCGTESLTPSIAGPRGPALPRAAGLGHIELRPRSRAQGLWLALAWLSLAGCQASRHPTPQGLIDRGEYSQAREIIHRSLPDDPGDRLYLLDRLKLGMVTLADGHPRAAEPTFQEVYDVLRTQGLNADRTVQSVVLYEGVKRWKGEPFEQALGLAYISVQQAALGRWDNARAAAGNSLFRLRDFRDEGERRAGRGLDPEALARRAAAREGVDEGYLDHGYAPRESDFAMGHLLSALASAQLGREDEASDHLRAASELNPRLRELAATLRARRYNALLVVSYGRGPRKQSFGRDDSRTRFVAVTRSGDEALLVRVAPSGSPPGARGFEDTPTLAFPIVCDVNTMARDHQWNSLEEVRRFKSLLGTGLLVGGIATTAAGAHVRSPEVALAGVAAAAVGALLKAGAQADTRHLDALPQRFYIAPLQLATGDRVQLQVAGDYGSRIVLCDIPAPAPGEAATLRYVRLLFAGTPPSWALEGRALYRNAHGGDGATGGELPLLLGGRDASAPIESTLLRAQQAGRLLDVTPPQFEQWHRDEGLAWGEDTQGSQPDRHVLEGGKSLTPPQAGTVGYARVFGRVWPAYRPTSASLRRVVDRLGANPATPNPATSLPTNR